MEKSISDRIDMLFLKANKIANESNPLRDSKWIRHKQNSVCKITNPKYINPEAYELYEVYLNDDQTCELFDILEGLPSWIDNYLSGRTSIKNMIEIYTPENLEKIILYHESIITKLIKSKIEFLKNKNNYEKN